MEITMKKHIAGILFIIFVLLDQFTKYLAKYFLEGKNPIVILDEIFELRYLEGGNTGMAFGLFADNTLILSFISLFAFVLLVFLFFRVSKQPNSFWVSFFIILMASGALGNWIDRFFRGYVIDFLYIKLIDFPIFNVADCYITISAFVLFFIVAFSKETQDNTTRKEV